MRKLLMASVALFVPFIAGPPADAAQSKIVVGSDTNLSWDISGTGSQVQFLGSPVELSATYTPVVGSPQTFTGTVDFGEVDILAGPLAGGVFPVESVTPLSGWTFQFNFPNGTASGLILVSTITNEIDPRLLGTFKVTAETGAFAPPSQFVNNMFIATFEQPGLPITTRPFIDERGEFSGALFSWGAGGGGGGQCNPGCVPAP